MEADKLTSLNLSLDRVIIQLIIPGLIAISPYFIIFLNYHTDTRHYLFTNVTITIGVLAILAIIAGLFLENFGGRIEVMWFDKINAKVDPNHQATWEKFLQLSYTAEPVGQRYLRNIVLRMKFELSMGMAIVLMWGGNIWLDRIAPIVENCILKFVLLYILPLLGCCLPGMCRSKKQFGGVG